MELYYNDNLSAKVREIGSGYNKVRRNRQVKKAANWYFTNFWFNVAMSVTSWAGFLWGLVL